MDAHRDARRERLRRGVGQQPDRSLRGGLAEDVACTGTARAGRTSPGGGGRFRFAWGTGSDVYFGGPNVYRYDGTQVTSVITGADYFYDVWKAASDRAYIVGCVGPSSCSAGVLYEFDGIDVDAAVNAPLGLGTERIWGRSDDDPRWPELGRASITTVPSAVMIAP